MSEYEVRLACEHGIYAEDYRDYLIERAWSEVSWVNSMQRIYNHSYDAFNLLRNNSVLTYKQSHIGDLMREPIDGAYVNKVQTLHDSVQTMLGSVSEEDVYPYLVKMAQEVSWAL